MRQVIQNIYFILDQLNKRVKWFKKPARVAGARVISVGNISMGGTGKTPMVIFLAKILSKKYKLGVVSRGYRGLLTSKGGIVSDGKKIFYSPYLVGDEPFLIASRVPNISVGIGKNKKRIAQELAYAHGLEIILIDDGFQHYAIARNLDIVLLDANDPFCEKNGLLREPPSSLARAKIIICTGSDGLSQTDKQYLIELIEQVIPQLSTKPKIFFSSYNYLNILDANFLLEKGLHSKEENIKTSEFFKGISQKYNKIFALSGIANHHQFENALLTLGVSSVDSLKFEDHHVYTLKDLAKIDQSVTKDDVIITTEKDWVKLAPFTNWVQSKNLFVLRIELVMSQKESEELFQLIEEA